MGTTRRQDKKYRSRAYQGDPQADLLLEVTRWGGFCYDVSDGGIVGQAAEALVRLGYARRTTKWNKHPAIFPTQAGLRRAEQLRTG